MVSDGVIGRVNNVPTVVLASPLSLHSGERAVLLATFPIARLASTLRPQVETDTARVVLFDRLGQAIVQPDPDHAAHLASVLGHPAVKAALAGESGHRIAEWNGVESLIAYTPVPGYGWGVLVVEPTAAAFASTNQHAMLGLALISASIVMFVGIVGFFSRRLVASFRREAHARLQAEAARQEVQQAVHMRDELLAVVIHDLRSPLAAIKFTVAGLQRRMQAGPLAADDELVRDLTNLQETYRYMDDLIASLLDVSSLQMGLPLRLERTSTGLVPLVAQVVTAYQESNENSVITFEASQSITGEWDAGRLRRVVENLLDNAVKYSPDGGAIHVAIDLDDVLAQCVVVLTVEDVGLGIPPDDLPFIFERFRRGSNVLGIVPGTGIGLAGARQIIEQHGGTIAVSTELGQGTRFTIRLPLAAGDQDLADATDAVSA